MTPSVTGPIRVVGDGCPAYIAQSHLTTTAVGIVCLSTVAQLGGVVLGPMRITKRIESVRNWAKVMVGAHGWHLTRGAA